MSEAPVTVPLTPDLVPDGRCWAVRQANFPPEISFYGPGLKHYQTSEFSNSLKEFVSISVTGAECALNCEHCRTGLLKDMLDLPRRGGSLYDLCRRLAEEGTRGVLISGGSNRYNQVPLLKYVPDLIRIRRELGLAIRVHPGLPDEETCAALAEVDLDGVMLDVIGDQATISEVYHLEATPDDYEAVLERLERYRIPTLPHIILGHYFGQMRGEVRALEMIRRHPPKALVLVILMPLTGTPMANAKPPRREEIAAFFATARLSLPRTPILLGCARPLGAAKQVIDVLAVEAGLNGIAYPAEGVVAYAAERGLKPSFSNACCGLTW